MGYKVEKAVFFSRLDELKAWREPCDRFYFGQEFCQRLLPLPAEARAALDCAGARGAPLTLVTSFVTNAGLLRVQELVASLVGAASAAQPSGFEVVVNDWGVLHWMRRVFPQIPLALGRLLTKQKRGPQIMEIGCRLPPTALDHFRRSNVDVPHVRQFLEQQGVRRVELDNLLQGLERPSGLPGSLYYPYGYITTTRLCLLARGDQPDKNLRSLGGCARECQKYNVTLRHAEMPVPLLLKGNTQFFHNPKLPADLQALHIDRLVFMPSIPI
jgi:hypothetical protein